MLAYVVKSLAGMNGADRLARDVLLALLRTGHEVAVVTDSRVTSSEVTEEVMLRQLRWVTAPARLPFPRSVNAALFQNLPRWVKWTVLDIAARKRELEVKSDLTIVNALGSHDFFGEQQLGRTGTTALIVHESPRHFGGAHQAMPLDWALAVMRSYDNLLFVSSHCRDEWLTYVPSKRAVSFYVPNCCREEDIAQLLLQERMTVRRQLGLPTDRLVAVCVATLQHRKGQDILVDSFRDLLAAAPELMLYLVGNTVNGTNWVRDSQSWTADLRSRVNALGFQDRIVFCGPRNDARHFIYAADLFILPSRAEAMPLTVLEAMALGTPILASNVDGIPEIVRHGHTGLLFDPQKPWQLIDGFSRLASSPELRSRLAASSEQRYWQHFSRERMAKAYREAVAKMLGTSAPAGICQTAYSV